VAALGAGEDDLVVLHEQPGARPAGRHAGLFHFALLYPSREELARAVQRLALTRTPISGASDHGVSEAIYLSDPDGNGIELYADRPRDAWPPASPGDRVGMFTRPLDLDDLLATVAGDEPPRHASAGLRMGHVHLHVGDLAAARDFYAGVLGFEEMTTYPGALFVAAGGYHHHVGLNTWRGEGVGPAPEGTVGLREWTIVLDADGIAALRARRAAAGLGDGDVAADPWGNRVRIAASS
jgi:catechol 2,3-dioxygenase